MERHTWEVDSFHSLNEEREKGAQSNCVKLIGSLNCIRKSNRITTFPRGSLAFVFHRQVVFVRRKWLANRTSRDVEKGYMSRKMEYQHNDELYYWNAYNKGRRKESRRGGNVPTLFESSF